MSQENVELVRRGFEAVRRGDWAALAALMDPHVLLRLDPRFPEQRIYGRDPVIAWYQGLWESGGTDIHIDEVMDLGDRVLARWCWHIRGPRSGIEGDQRGSGIYTFRRGQIVLEEHFLEHEEALEAVGLEE